MPLNIFMYTNKPSRGIFPPVQYTHGLSSVCEFWTTLAYLWRLFFCPFCLLHLVCLHATTEEQDHREENIILKINGYCYWSQWAIA